MKDIEIDNLSLEELIELNHKIVERIREKGREKISEELAKFQIGNEVIFKNEEGKEIRGRVIRINQKTLSVKTNEGCWYVNPAMVRKLG